MLGEKGEDAADTVQMENPDVDAEIITVAPVSWFDNDDFSCNRVRVWVNYAGIVVSAPKVS